MSEKDNKATIEHDLKGNSGAVPNRPQAPLVKSAMSFSMDGVYVGLKPSFKFDEKTQEWKEQPLTLKASFFGQFVTIPQSGKFWREFGQFCLDLGNAIGNKDFAKARVSGSQQEVAELLSKY